MMHSGQPSHHHHHQGLPQQTIPTTQQTHPPLQNIPPMSYPQMIELYNYLSSQLSNPNLMSLNNGSNHPHFLSSSSAQHHASSVPSHSYAQTGTSSLTPQSLPENIHHSSNSFQHVPTMLTHHHSQPVISDDTIALSQDIDQLYQEMEHLVMFKNKQKEINKAIETIVKEKYTQQKKEEQDKKLKKELMRRYKNPTRKQHQAATIIQNWFRKVSSHQKNKQIQSLRTEIDSLKYQLQMLRVEQQTCIQLVRLLFEQVQFLSKETH
ncbi:hypothetical protein C9374_014388 [Naegleria lovaniensis]|uniref:Uncharacterized protein n=1 Tax=Naegleria lovaniensis TaxID=51637 RepID=A0AA88KP31_NAELO|nr:uncharacterized protein C9374_014388 [Naegleria lovaniensis]KAG2388988.1 hypothetical protein C9374_014388 [Naegleria lovaniensis]